MSGEFYRRFEDRYRGSRAIIKQRLRAYLPFVEPLQEVELRTALDLGCGRGEWLELLGEIGFSARGVDVDEAMLAGCREQGLDVTVADALQTLQSLPDNCIGLITAFHVVEHIGFDSVGELVRQALRVLAPGGLLIVETPNPENLTVGTASFYLDPSHQRPLPPALLDFVVEYAGFERHLVVRLQEDPSLHGAAPIGLINVIEGVSPDYGIVAQKAGNAKAAAALALPFSRTYGISLGQLGARFESQEADRRAEMHAHISRIDESTALLGHEIGLRLAQLGERTEQVAGQLSQTLAEQSLMLQETRQAGMDRLESIEREIIQANDARTHAQVERAVAEAERSRAESERALAEAQRVRAESERARAEAAHLKSEFELSHRDERIRTLLQQLDDLQQRHASVGLIEQKAARLQAEELVKRLDAAEKAATLAAEAHERERMVLHGHIGAVERRVFDLLSSRSWRVTAPMRSIGSSMRVLRNVAPTTVDVTSPHGLREALRRLGQAVLRRPRLKRIAMNLLARSPRIRARLRRLMYQSPAVSVPPLPPLQEAGGNDLSPRAARAYAALRQVIRSNSRGSA